MQLTVATVCACSLLAGCDAPPEALTPDTPKEESLALVNVRLGWAVNANSAGQVAAAELGFYRGEGLDVRLHSGGLVDPSVRTVAAGADTIGFANGPELVIAARAAGAPLRIFGTVQNKGYHVFCAKKESGIRTPADWIGRRIGVKIGSPTYLQYKVLLSKFGIESSQVEEIPLGKSLQPFLANQVDVYPGAATNEVVSLQLQGVQVHCISAEDYDVPTMGNVMFAAEETISTQSKMLRRFLRATMRGWEWCRLSGNRASAVEFLMATNPKLDARKEAKALDLTLDLIGSGSVDRRKLEQITLYQREFAGLSGGLSIEDLVADLRIAEP